MTDRFIDKVYTHKLQRLCLHQSCSVRLCIYLYK